MAEEVPSAALLAVLPDDAPPGHRAHTRVQLVGRRCKASYSRGRGGVFSYQTVVGDCGGSELAALRIARAMWLRLEQGETNQEVSRFRAECCQKVRAVMGAGVKREPDDEDAAVAAAAAPEGEEEDAASPPSKATGSSSSSSAAPASSASSTKRRKSSICSPQAEPVSCGRHSSSSSTLSPFGKVSAEVELSFGTGVRTLREALVQKGLETRGSWVELVNSIENAEEAEQSGEAPSASAASPSPGEQGLPTVDLTMSQEAPPAAEAPVTEPAETAASPRAAAAKRKVTAKRPPATPLRRVSSARLRAR